MKYFNPEFIEFFKGLSQHNNKEWFDKNRKIYEKEVKKPFSDFVGEMIERISQYEPEIQIKPSDAIMRINNDIRFSKDKSPYKSYVAANISKYGKKDKSYPGFYFQLSPEKIEVFGGAYMIDKERLQNIRDHIAAHTKDFSSVYNNEAFKAKFGKIRGEQHKRLPKEFQEIAEKESLIANKQFYYTAELPASLITSEKLPNELMEYYLTGKKLNDFLRPAFL